MYSDILSENQEERVKKSTSLKISFQPLKSVDIKLVCQLLEQVSTTQPIPLCVTTTLSTSGSTLIKQDEKLRGTLREILDRYSKFMMLEVQETLSAIPIERLNKS